MNTHSRVTVLLTVYRHGRGGRGGEFGAENNLTHPTDDPSFMIQSQVWDRDSPTTGCAVTVTSAQPRIVSISGYSFGTSSSSSFSSVAVGGGSTRCERHLTGSFTVHAVRVGRTSLKIACCTQTRDQQQQQQQLTAYSVVVVRRVRTADVAFNWAMVVSTGIISFSLGCATDIHTLRKQFINNKPVLLTVSCQFIVLPTVSTNNNNNKPVLFTVFFPVFFCLFLL